MQKELKVMHKGDWSLNLEDPYYEENSGEILAESVAAVEETKPGFFVNVVTPGSCGDPRDWLIPQLSGKLAESAVTCREIRYIDQCGCGGYVTRIFR